MNKKYRRLKHPVTGDFVAEYHIETDCLVVTKHGKTATINLAEERKKYCEDNGLDYEQYRVNWSS